MKQILTFLAGVIAGVAGVTLYYIYGKPVLPSEPTVSGSKPHEFVYLKIVDETDALSGYEVISCEEFIDSLGDFSDEDKAYVMKVERERASTIPDPDSIKDMGITQEVKVNPHKLYYFDEHGTEVSREEFMRDLSDDNKELVEDIERERTGEIRAHKEYGATDVSEWKKESE